MASITDLVTNLGNAVQAANAIATAIKNMFPAITGTSTTVPTAGALTFTSSQAAGFITTVTSSGATVKIAYY